MTRAPDPPPDDSQWGAWARDFVRVYNLDSDNITRNNQAIGVPLRPGVYTVSQLTASSYGPLVPRPNPPRLAFCSGVSGTTHPVPVYSDGTSWRLISNNATVS